MNIVYVIRETPQSVRCGGIGSYVWDLASYLSSKGNNISIICASDDRKQDHFQTHDGVNIYFVQNPDYYVSKSRFLSLFFSKILAICNYSRYRKALSIKLEELIDEGKADIVEFAEFGGEGFIWQNLYRRIPMIVRLHGPTILNRRLMKLVNPLKSPLLYFFGLLEISTVKSADFLSAPSQDMANFFCNDLGIKRSKCSVIYNGVNARDWISECEENVDVITIFSAGSVVDTKGYRELFEACKYINSDSIKVNLVIAGSIGSLGTKLLKESRRCNGDKWFSLLGHISRDQLVHYYKSSSLVCFPSWWENLPVVCIEAMASKALVLGSSSGGMAEAISDGVDGFLVPPKNIKILIKKINNILRMPNEKKQRIRESAQIKATEIYGYDKIANQQLAFYESCLSKFHSNK